MNSGLSKTVTSDFTVAWGDSDCFPNAEISYNPKRYTTSIHPYCTDGSENQPAGWTLAVYRREYNGSFTKIASGISNGGNVYVTDPHPALDYARYRVVAVNDTNGSMEYYDVPGYPINEPAIVIQWNEEWTNRDDDSPDALDKPAWAGSLLYLPYNVDVSNSMAPDVSMVNYIGREHPVSYYGTHKGETASWNTSIPASDTETIYALRRLQNWMGDVYVREPSGVGYWANITLSFTITHKELVIPVSFTITRVTGGV